ncbi:hypothetical protein [Flavobacterium sp. H122]|uniref:hypothetical protein n=1 Tax=Flavobacterium sp. H122 TaxID=2529860 RepID=UPI0010AA8BD0|nr:hypothetical protein [Flavobacterium sp. H122]
MLRIVLFLMFLNFNLYSQNQKINGIVESDLGVHDGVLVVNRTNKQNTFTSNGGQFVIEADPDDVLVFSSPKTEPLEIRLNSNSFRQNPLKIKVRVKPSELAEIKIVDISAKRLGVVDNSVKTYTPAERKLRTAGTFKWYSPLLIPFGGMSVDGLINQISGRTSRLKKEAKIERNEFNLAKLKTTFPEDFYISTLSIPPDYIEGFLVYASENPKVVQCLKEKNKNVLRFALTDLAFQYKELISTEINTFEK